MPAHPISVVVPTRAGWPGVRTAIDPLLPQIQALGAQLIVSDATANPAPEWAKDAGVIWLRVPNAAGYELRQAAYSLADAPIVAVTEDHCQPASDWLERILEAHASEPTAAAIYGIVDNGTPDHAIDWALYGASYLAWGSPAPADNGNPGHANLSFKAWALRDVRPTADEVMEFRFLAALREAGHTVLASDRPRVLHHQSTGFLGTSELFFHDGRGIAGLRRQRMRGADWARLVAPALFAGYRTLRTLRTARSKPSPAASAVMRILPLVAWLHLVHAMGECVGYLDGPADSFKHLH